MQLINVLGASWKKLLKGECAKFMMISLFGHNLAERSQVFFVNKTNSNKLNGKRIWKI